MKSLSSCICHDLLTPQQGRLRKTFLGKHQKCYAFLVRQIAYFILSTYFVLLSLYFKMSSFKRLYKLVVILAHKIVSKCNPSNIFDQSIYISLSFLNTLYVVYVMTYDTKRPYLSRLVFMRSIHQMICQMSFLNVRLRIVFSDKLVKPSRFYTVFLLKP